MPLLDLHSHILPYVDDGAENTETAITLLKEMKKQGITHVVATPHFDAASQSMPEYVAAVRRSYEKVLKATAEHDLPHVFVGSEVFYFPNISQSEGIRALSLGGSNYFLLELPFCRLDKTILKDIVGLRENLGLTPILAHIERYAGLRGYRDVLKLIESGVALAQLNATSILQPPYKRVAQKLIKKNLISFIATDTHSPDHRPPKMQEALTEIETLFGKKQRDIFIENSARVCSALKETVYEE